MGNTDTFKRWPSPRKILVFVLGFVLGMAPSVAMVRPAAAPQAHSERRLVIRFRSESDTGLSAADDTATAKKLKGLPKSLAALHARWGAQSLARVRHGNGAPAMAKKNPAQFQKRALRAPREGANRAQTLRSHFRRTAVIELAPGADLSQALSDYRANPEVEWAEPARAMQIQGVPNDPSFSSLWGMTKIQAPAAWDLAKGNGVVVAVVDTGVDHTHPDLTTNIWSNAGEIPGNGIDDDGNGYVDDVRGWNFVSNTNAPFDGHSHGTHVSGTISAVGNNGIGVIGVAPSAKIMAVKGLGDDGSGYDSDLAQGIIYAADNGADVINMSWGGTGDSPVIEDAIEYAHSLGVVLVAAAGNSAIDASQFLPAKYAAVITVSAFNSADVIAPFSNFGTKIDVAAPGVSILSTVPGGYYSSYNGTSMASPHVAGLAALLLSQHPAYTNEQVRQAIRRTADDVAAPGVDTQAGYGRINAFKALQTQTPPNLAITWPTQFAIVGGSVTVRGSVDGTTIASRQLQYGAGESPASFTNIGTPAAGAVTNGPLGVWDVSALAEGLYSLRLSVTDGTGGTWAATVSPIRVDRTAPLFVSVSPSNGVSLPASSVSVSASVTDNYGIARLDFKIDSVLVSSRAPTQPTNAFDASLTWDAAATGAGPHTLSWTAYDTAGNTASVAQNVTVINDSTPPTVALTAPAPNSAISGTVLVEATAADNVAVKHVLFQLDNSSPFATVSTPPYRAPLSTGGVSLGTHTLTATAVDASSIQSSHTIHVVVVPDTTAPLLSNLNVTVLSNDVRFTWTTDEPANDRVEYGTTPAFGFFSSLSAGMGTVHQADLLNLPPGTLYYYRALSQDGAGNQAASPTDTFQSSDEAPPIGRLTSPPNGSTVSGNVAVTGESTDENSMTRVDLLMDGHYWATIFGSPPPQTSIGSTRQREPDPPPFVIPQAQTTTWSYSLDTSQLDDGPHMITARSFDGADHSQDDARSVIIQNGARIAKFDSALGVPLCAEIGATCASGGLLEARSVLTQFPEPNHPNTVLGACADGESGRYHTDESNDWIRVTSLNGGALKAGTLARVESKVWAYSTKNNYLDLYVTSNTAHPQWTHVSTVQPTQTRSTIIVSTFTLPAGGETQAVRANFRYQGSQGICTAGDYDDHDDLAFAVQPADAGPPAVTNELSLGEFYARPHPVTNGSATLHVEAANADRLSLKIYSLTGQSILDHSTTASPDGPTLFEYVWQTGNVAAGTYYWRVEAEKEGKKVSAIHKISVVK